MMTLDEEDLDEMVRSGVVVRAGDRLVPKDSEELQTLRRMVALLESLLAKPEREIVVSPPDVHVSPPEVHVAPPQVVVKAPDISPPIVSVQPTPVTVNPHQPIRRWELIVSKLPDGSTKVTATAAE